MMTSLLSTLQAYVPVDRRLALARQESLPDRVLGSALFADVSGFSALTGALAKELGRQSGAERVLDYINPVFEALITCLYDYRGSVIGFAGDSITCWLDGDDGRRALACALSMQESMSHFAVATTPGGTQVKLSIKIAVAAGPARRFLVGNPELGLFDVLAGATLERMAAAENLAGRGEVVASKEVVENLGPALEVMEWRVEVDGGRFFALVGGLNIPVPLTPWLPLPEDALQLEQVRPYVDPLVFRRMQGDSSTDAGVNASYLAELRPAVALFMKFSGLDYDGNEQAGERLDALIRRVQGVLACYGGTFIQLTVGDKGNFLYAAFGAPFAHLDDAARAVGAALELSTLADELPGIEAVHIGVSQGLMRVGAYGGRQRCTYGVLGDNVNMAARLMSKAEPGQVLVRGQVAEATAYLYHYVDLGWMQVKGKEEPLKVFAALGRQDAFQQTENGDNPIARRLAAFHGRPLVGREDILASLQQTLASVRSGNGILLRLQGQAGVGKSHLAAVFSQQAAAAGWQVVYAPCESSQRSIPYHPWRAALIELLALPPAAPHTWPAVLAAHFADRPNLALRLPLLGDILSASLPENPLTAHLEPRLRREMLFSLVVEILRSQAGEQPVLLVLEDAHWIDEASAALVLAVGRALLGLPLLLFWLQRSALTDETPTAPGLERLPSFSDIELGDLAPAAVRQLAQSQLGGAVSALLEALLTTRAQGTPLFTIELLDALRQSGSLQQTETGWDLSAAAFNALLEADCLVKVYGAWHMRPDPPLGAARLELPDSVHAAVLAHLDRLPEEHKLSLKAASVIGRSFDLPLLQAIHPASPDFAVLHAQLEMLQQQGLLHQESSAQPPRYAFAHNTTQEVAYQTLLFAQRRTLHAHTASWYEAQLGDGLSLSGSLESLSLDTPAAAQAPLLAYHWGQAQNSECERLYTWLAGQQAARRYANESALRCFSRGLELTSASQIVDRCALYLAREQIYEFTGQRAAQAADLSALQALTERLFSTPESFAASAARLAAIALRRALYAKLTGEYTAALQLTDEAFRFAQQAGDLPQQALSAQRRGEVLWRQGDLPAAREQLEDALALARQADALRLQADIQNMLGLIAKDRGEYPPAQSCYEQARQIYRQVGDLLGQAKIENQLAFIYLRLGAHEKARAAYEQALNLYCQLGHREGESMALGNLGYLIEEQGDYMNAIAFYQQSLQISRQLGDQRRQATNLNNLGYAFARLGQYENARHSFEQAVRLTQELGNRRYEGMYLASLSLLYHQLGEQQAALEAGEQSLSITLDIGDRSTQAAVLACLGHVHAVLDQYSQAGQVYQESLALYRELDLPTMTTEPLAGLARLALAQNQPAAALAHVEPIWQHLQTANLDGAEEPFRIYLTCYQVFAANQDERAAAVLFIAYDLLQQRAARIPDEATRRSFIEGVAAHRQLEEAYRGLAGQIYAMP